MRHAHRIVRMAVYVGLASSLGLALFLGGCGGNGAAVPNPFDRERVAADVDIAGEMTKVEASSNARCEAGVKHLRAENWSAAAEELKIAVAENPKDWRAAYALGVAYERMGKNAEALQAYQQANLNVKGEGDSDITAAILRLKENP